MNTEKVQGCLKCKRQYGRMPRRSSTELKNVKLPLNVIRNHYKQIPKRTCRNGDKWEGEI